MQDTTEPPASPPQPRVAALEGPRTPARVTEKKISLQKSHGIDSDEDDTSQGELPTTFEDQVSETGMPEWPPLTLDDRQSELTETNTESTPLSNAPRNSRTQGANKEQRKLMDDELNIADDRKVKILSMEEAKNMYHDVATGKEIDQYLTKSKLYSRAKKCWTKVPRDEPKEGDLYQPLTDITSDIVDHFKPDSIPDGVSRQVVLSKAANLLHDNGTSTTSPDICVKAAGPSFETPKSATKHGLGYTNIAAVFDAKTEQGYGGPKQSARQLGVYAKYDHLLSKILAETEMRFRQLFIHQPNRNFVRAIIITEEHAQLFHFDRGGVYATPSIKIHDTSDPEKRDGAYMFVRWVLGLTSYNEEEIGLDTSIQWKIDSRGRKSSGTVTVNQYDAGKEAFIPVVYDLNMEEPPFVRPSLAGRGTTIWPAKEPGTGAHVLIKDSWRTDTRTPESQHMEAANDAKITGIPEMVGFQDYCAQTKDYRPPNFNEDAFFNRVKLRIVIKKHGLSIWYFRSRLQLLQALVAVIIAHAELFKNGILHRDISMQNIILGSPTSGSAGYLIDLDMALDISVDRTLTGVSKDKRTGLMIYQSYWTLEGMNLRKKGLVPPPHDYLDDLECFLYITCHIVFAFERPGVWVEELPGDMMEWTEGKPSKVASMKRSFCEDLAMDTNDIPSWWGPHCATLLEEYAKVVFDIQRKKNAIFKNSRLTAAAKRDAQLAFAKATTQHYELVVNAFHKAIAGLEEEGLAKEERVLYQLSPNAAAKCLHFPLSSIVMKLPFEYRLPLDLSPPTSMKRRSQGHEEDDIIPCKRNRQGPSPLSAAMDVTNDTTVAGDDDSGSDM
ncbi:hypothetical protein FA13DRAFT_1921280 [Coprinellus micaceus]|uniref:Fungal-type protein kinase domain-containing protein n=1 Tax=Coprinellus micaceus TaxID=71717 RepID=A0A4Y7SJZ2_COPMI|nr:hypothetical protein FA13DRAFT_1921280 [Coprinellus micaceus]